MTTRSTRLYSGVAGNSVYTTLYTVPAGKRLVLRSVVMHDVTAGGHVALLYARPGGVSGPLVALKRVAASASNTPYIYDTWTVLDAGDVLQVYTDSASLHVQASGALLVV